MGGHPKSRRGKRIGGFTPTHPSTGYATEPTVMIKADLIRTSEAV